MKNNKAFTLIELLVVIAVVSLLSSIVFASLSSAREKSQDSHKVSEAKEVEKAIELYRLDNNYAVPAFANSESKGVLHEEGSDEYNEVMNKLVDDGYIATVPESPSGTDYGYIVSEDGMSAMFYSNQSDSSSTGDVCVRVGDDTFDQVGTGTSCTGSIATAEACFNFSAGSIIGYDDIECSMDVAIPSTIGGESVTGINQNAFFAMSLTSVIIPNSVTIINDGAFYQSSLSSVTIPNSVTTIGDGAFYYTQLTSVIIPDNVTYIGGSAFYGTPLTSVSLKSGTPYSSYSFPESCTVSSGCITER